MSYLGRSRETVQLEEQAEEDAELLRVLDIAGRERDPIFEDKLRQVPFSRGRGLISRPFTQDLKVAFEPANPNLMRRFVYVCRRSFDPDGRRGAGSPGTGRRRSGRRIEAQAWTVACPPLADQDSEREAGRKEREAAGDPGRGG